MLRNQRGRYGCAPSVSVGKLALIASLVLLFVPSTSQASNKNVDYTPVLSHTFQPRQTPAKISHDDVATLESKDYYELGSIQAFYPTKDVGKEAQDKLEALLLKEVASHGGDLVRIETENVANVKQEGFRKTYCKSSKDLGNGNDRCVEWHYVTRSYVPGLTTTGTIWRHLETEDKPVLIDVLPSVAGTGNIHALKQLLSWGVSVNAVDQEGHTALHRAAMNPDCPDDVTLFLLNNGANVDATAKGKGDYSTPGDGGKTPLMLAAKADNWHAIKVLASHGANVNYATKDGRTALMDAAENGQVESLKALLALGADKSLSDRLAKTAAGWASLELSSDEHLDVEERLDGNEYYKKKDAKLKEVLELLSPSSAAAPSASAAVSTPTASTTPAAAQPPSDTVFEMPGVFRIALPPGWQKTKVIDDRYTVAAFSSKDLTLEVMRDLDNTPAEQYARTLPYSQLVGLWDEYPGRFTPPEVLANPDPNSYESTTANRFDEYTLFDGLPAQWVRYRLEYKKTSEDLRVTRVWIVTVLSPGQYWSLALRGDDRSWPASDADLRRMVRSFHFLEPMLARVKAAIPPEAWKRMPSNLPEGSCQFAGSASGIGVVVPCDTKVTLWLQVETDHPTVVGKEELEVGGGSLLFIHHVANWSAEEYARAQEQGFAAHSKGEKYEGHEASYQQDDKREVSVDGTPGTSITATIRFKKARREGLRRLLTVSKGTDHFYIWCSYASNNSDQIARIFDSIRIFALHPQLSAVSSRDDAMAGVVDAILERSGGNVSAIFSDPASAPARREAKPAHDEIPTHDEKPAPQEKPAPPSAHEMERIREDVRLLNDSGSHYRLGKALDASGNHAAAFKEFETAVHLNHRNAEADQEIARVYAAHNDIARAIAASERSLNYSLDRNNDANMHVQLALLYAANGNTLYALFHQANAGEGAPDLTLPTVEIAPGQKAVKDLEEQVEAAEKSLGENFTLQNRLRLADLDLKLGDFTGADTQCSMAHLNDPRNVQALACLVKTANARGEHDTIVGYAKEWLALAPNNPEPYYWLARGYYWDPADYAKAAESHEAVIRNAAQVQIAPAMLRESHLGLAFDYENLHLWQNAASAHDSAVREFPADAQVLNAAAWFFATTERAFRNPVKALDYANRALAAAPGDANIMDTLAEAYFVNGRINDAVATEQKALALAPERADLQKQMEKFKKAKKTEPPHRK